MSRLHERRQRDRREDEIDATQGKFGPEYSDEQLASEEGEALLISEVHLLLDRVAKQDKKDEPQGRDPMSMPVFKKCFDYCDMFSKYRDDELARKVRQELSEHAAVEEVDEEGNVVPQDNSKLQLTRFEMAQLANLSIESVEEAKILIPTLALKDDNKLQTLLDELATKRKFQT